MHKPEGIYVTLKGYTNDALQLAQKHNITLLGEPGLVKMLEDLNWKQNPEILALLDDTRKLCPKCESQMVLRTATCRHNPIGWEAVAQQIFAQNKA